MTSLADQLPPEIARQIHPDYRKNEAAYHSAREGLLAQHHGRWVAFADGAVIASGTTPLEVFLAIRGSDRHPFVARVGHEAEPWYRVRRQAFSYDASYPGTALPVAEVEFRAASGTPGTMLDRVIPDTGSDTTTLPRADCQRMGLDPAAGVPGVISGVGGGLAVTIGYLVWAWLDGQEYPCQLQGDFAAQERILGRDVMNRLRVLFDGPAGEVVFNP
ncbi:MAG: retropepsin-like domain-containing protein [Gemmataceae bacterium]|nr:retropepsin-like domain-containing protein [Gemmataceae bacterium]